MQIANNGDLSWFRSHMEVRKKHVSYIGTRFNGLNRIIDGLYPGTLSIVAARPGKGKTTFSQNLVDGLIDKHRVLIFSTETSKEVYFEKLVCIRAEIPHKSVRTDIKSVIEPMEMALGSLENGNLFINDNSGPTLDTVRRAIDIVEPKIVVFDYFQNIGFGAETGGYSSFKSSHERYAGAIQQFANIAREKKIHVCVTSQLKRFTDGRHDDDRPMLSDLKETGKLEEAAHLVMFLYANRPRDEYMNVEIAKNRDGEIGEFKVKGLWDSGTLQDAI